MTMRNRAFKADDYDWNMAMARAVAEDGNLSKVLRAALRAYAEGMTQGTQYFTSSTNNALLRRTRDDEGMADEVHREDGWHPTSQIAQYMNGDENNVEPISEAQARKIAPEAF